MNPQNTPQPMTPEAIMADNKRKTRRAILFLAGPAGLLVGSLLLSATVGFFTGMAEQPTATTDSLFAASTTPSPIRAITNLICFVAGIIATIGFIPGIVAGIVLLSSRKPVPPRQ